MRPNQIRFYAKFFAFCKKFFTHLALFAHTSSQNRRFFKRVPLGMDFA
jgi:hypothetical protein